MVINATIWILVIILTGFIGAMIYYFLIKKTDSHQDRIIGIALVASVVIVIFFMAGTPEVVDFTMSR